MFNSMKIMLFLYFDKIIKIILLIVLQLNFNRIIIQKVLKHRRGKVFRKYICLKNYKNWETS